MRFKMARGRSFLTAKTFTIGMVAINAAGLVAVQQKLKQAQVPNSYALDDGAHPLVARNEAILPDRRIMPGPMAEPAPMPPEPLPALPAIRPLPVIDLADLDLVEPVAPPEQAFGTRAESGIALAVEKPIQTRSAPSRRHAETPSAKLPAEGNSFSSAFDHDSAATSETGLTLPVESDSVAAGPHATPPPGPQLTAPEAEAAPPASSDLALPAEQSTAPRLDPSASQFFPAAPVQDAPAELPAAA